jgi:GT2 family glycosyltransferase
MSVVAASGRQNEATVDVVVVQYGQHEFLYRCIDSLERAEEKPNRIIVVVNGIRGVTVDQLRHDQPRVDLIVNEQNLGYPRAANQGLRLSTARYVVLLNNDVQVDPKWLGPLRKIAVEHPEAALVQPKVLSSIEPERFDYAGGVGGFIDGYGYPCQRGRVFQTMEIDRGQYDEPCELFWASGAALLIDREAALEIGGLDEDLFIFHEESDLAWRLHLHGRTVWSCPDSRIFHHGSASFKESRELSALQYYMMHRNDLILVIKNWGSQELRFRLPIRVLLELASWPYFALTNPSEFKEAVKATIWLASHVQEIRRMRRGSQSIRTHADDSYRHLMIRGILPLRYFLGRDRLFSQLDRYPPPNGRTTE